MSDSDYLAGRVANISDAHLRPMLVRIPNHLPLTEDTCGALKYRLRTAALDLEVLVHLLEGAVYVTPKSNYRVALRGYARRLASGLAEIAAMAQPGNDPHQVRRVLLAALDTCGWMQGILEAYDLDAYCLPVSD